MKRNLGTPIILLTALIWGSAFVAQSAGMDYVGPFTFQAARSILGCAVLLPVIMIMDIFKKKKQTYEKPVSGSRKTLITGGICCGFALAVASGLQQFGMQYTDAGKAGFITALYILLVPIFGLFIKKKTSPIIFLCVALGLVGLYLLCVKDGFTFEKGDIYLLLCAVVFSLHILIVDYFSPKVNGVKLSCIQFFTVFILSFICCVIFEKPDFSALKEAAFPIFYAGVMSCGVAYTLQIIGQKYTEPTVASLLMSFEAVFAVLSGMLILHEQLTIREWIGCAIMFQAIIISQLPFEKNKS